MTKVVITNIPLRYYFYYQWLILGLYELQAQNKIMLIIKPKSFLDRLFLWKYKFYLGLRKYLKLFTKENITDYSLKGYVLSNGKKQNFCYDIADTPYYFDIDELKRDVLYFKAQCPITIDNDGFGLTSTIKIPYHPIALENKDKIRPAMLGPGGRSYNIYSYKSLLTGYKSLFLDKVEKSGNLMCYFGGNKGPEPVFSYQPDLYLNESHILGYFGRKVNHPNEKRGIATKLIMNMGKGSDGRIIKEFINGSSAPKINEELFIPLTEYTQHISKFDYNLNISGFRNSIPFRFIYSFCVGTAIITDKLSVKWYLPFENELVETIEMGYLPNSNVDWNGFNHSIKSLPEIKSSDVLIAFEKKWSPQAFAGYVVNLCVTKLL